MRSILTSIIKHYSVMTFWDLDHHVAENLAVHALACKSITKIRNEYSFRSRKDRSVIKSESIMFISTF
jgi:hypothetical protein